jgi:hypothetical protein
MPRAHQSALELCPLPRTTSGAKYSGVPQKVYAFSSFYKNLAKPKSANFKYPFSSSNKFSNFRSQYINPLECRFSKAKIIQPA